MTRIYLLLIVLLAASLPAHSEVGSDQAAAEIELLLDKADANVWLGIAHKGGALAFEDGLDQIQSASSKLDTAGLPPEQTAQLRREIAEMEEQLKVLSELSEERFYGVYPLARLLSPDLTKGDGLAATEQLFHHPGTAAVEIAGENFSTKIKSVDIPSAVIYSHPRNPVLENVAFEVLAREGSVVPVNRRGLSRILGPEELAKFDREGADTAMVVQLMSGLNVESLTVMKLSPTSASGGDLVKISMTGDLYRRGATIEGPSAISGPPLRVARVVSFGTVRDRREQLWPIALLQLATLIGAMIIASRPHWVPGGVLAVKYKLAIGAGLFAYGRVFAIILMVVLGRAAPEPTDMALASGWWPAALGLGIILLSGMLAWIGQARLTNVIPGARGARAVGTIFGLSTLGCISYFVRPIMLLEGPGGYFILPPLLLSALGLSVLFAYAVRTGPPVPGWFAFGPLIGAAVLGVSLLTMSLQLLWGCTALTAVLYILAIGRYRYRAAHGIEEPVPDSDEAALADEQRLMKLMGRLKKK